MSEKITTANERYARDIGFDYGNSNSDVQAELLNGFAAGMTSSPNGSLDMQISYIVDRMDSKSRKLIKHIAGFVEEAE